MRRWALGVAAGLGAVLLAAGCGTGGVARGHPDVANGQKLFTGAAQCSACHTLAAAGSSGTIGPNLDDAFRADREQGFDQSAIENVVLDQIRLGSGPLSTGTPMPSGLVKGQDALDVAAYVASVAGTGPATSGGSPAQLGTNGEAIFKGECAGCHTLKAAGTTGTVGPNLDQLKPKQAIVVHQVTNGGAVMPAFRGKLSPAQIQAVATYVATNAGK
ncbi:MAG TPA: c-type cytochrome [Gaiellaceae bacterium]|nr:c-type cytochrome [Gaiellaceae bacterium]